MEISLVCLVLVYFVVHGSRLKVSVGLITSATTLERNIYVPPGQHSASRLKWQGNQSLRATAPGVQSTDQIVVKGSTSSWCITMWAYGGKQHQHQ